MTVSQLRTLRDHRALLLGCEAIGWVHMAGKAHPDFLRQHGGQSNGRDYKAWFKGLTPDWDSGLSWLRSSFASLAWPNSLTEFLRDFEAGASKPSAVGLLQAAHAMASGIEKNHPKETSKYLSQDVTHMWLSSPFGHHDQNLLVAPPPVLQSGGHEVLMADIGRVLDELGRLANPFAADAEPWAQWRSQAIGPKSVIRQSFLTTLAETRVPNNDVTLWDQSYVASALFKSAVAGAVLAGTTDWKGLKPNTRWRVLTVGIGAEHYESRAVRIGDWTSMRVETDAFFDDVCRLLEVDVAVGSLVYRDSEVLAFTFPGARLDATKSDAKSSVDHVKARSLRDELSNLIDGFAKQRRFEVPPLVTLSDSTRSFISMAKQLELGREALAVPLHRTWPLAPVKGNGHACPVCLVRPNGTSGDKAAPCPVCRGRRRGRLAAWLDDKIDQNTIWISEVADHTDRVALVSVNLGLDSWLDGAAVDSLRAQSISDWRANNVSLGSAPNPVTSHAPFASLKRELASRVVSFDGTDMLMRNLQDGFQHDSSWDSFFEKVVQDRSNAPSWTSLTDDERAAWLAHQLFRKNVSPGRVYRFWRTSEASFQGLLATIRERVSRHENRWRVRRLVIHADGDNWEDRETYHGVWRDAPLGLVYRAATRDFVTITNLARCLGAMEEHKALEGQTIEVAGDDLKATQRLTITKVEEKIGHLGAYHPVIPLELSPRRFRLLVPLDAVDDIVAVAKERWEKEFGRVWDRLPLRIGAVAFPRTTPFQAVIEAIRNVEDDLAARPVETWRVAEARQDDGVSAVRWIREDARSELSLTPSRLPDGRVDAHYPYLAVEDRKIRFPRDFQHPRGQVYRHVANLRPGDGALVRPSLFAAVFLESTARRFEHVEIHHLSDIAQRVAAWTLVREHAPSMTALRGALTAIEDAHESWLKRSPSPQDRETWLGFVRAVLHDTLETRGAALDALVDAAGAGVLVDALRWNVHILKQNLEATDEQ